MNGLEASLVRDAGIATEILDRARERQRDGKGLGDVLQEMGAIDGGPWGEIQARHFGLPFVGTLPQEAVPPS